MRKELVELLKKRSFFICQVHVKVASKPLKPTKNATVKSFTLVSVPSVARKAEVAVSLPTQSLLA